MNDTSSNWTFTFKMIFKKAPEKRNNIFIYNSNRRIQLLYISQNQMKLKHIEQPIESQNYYHTFIHEYQNVRA